MLCKTLPIRIIFLIHLLTVDICIFYMNNKKTKYHFECSLCYAKADFTNSQIWQLRILIAHITNTQALTGQVKYKIPIIKYR